MIKYYCVMSSFERHPEDLLFDTTKKKMNTTKCVELLIMIQNQALL